jgi:hypothetical protein
VAQFNGNVVTNFVTRWIKLLSSAIAIWAMLLAPSFGQPQQQWRWENVSRVVVVGDVHGAYEAVIEALQDAAVIDGDLNWVGGTTHLVSLGDLVDRGAEARRVMDLFMRLQSEAAGSGGRVHVLLGNHELMNLIGDLRYVAPGDYAAFSAEEDPASRAAAFVAYAASAASGDSPDTRAAFDAAYPPGFFARQAAFAAGGVYGAWLLTLSTLLVIDDTVYVHGGLPPVVAEIGPELNTRVRADLERFMELRERLAAQGVLVAYDRRRDIDVARAARATVAPELAAETEEFIALADAVELGPDGPHWYRGSVYCKPILEESVLDAGLERLAVRRAVVGHTPTIDHRVRALYDGKLVMADTGMLFEYFRGRPAAVVIDGAELEVRYLRPPQLAQVETSGRLVAYGRTEAELNAALSQWGVQTVDRAGSAGPWPVVLENDGATIQATFIPRGGDRASDFELAAAALDELLGTALVAPTVARAIDGQEGALQLRYPDAVNETDRLARGLGFGGWCPLAPQLQLMYAFDLLIGNRGRTAGNVAFANDLSDLLLTEHWRAFGTERTLPPSVDLNELQIPVPLVAALRSLDEARLQESVGAWLEPRRVRALLMRRDRLVRE